MEWPARRVGLCLAGVLLLSAPIGGAKDFTVDTTADFVDASPGDGVCAGSRDTACSLRAAVQEANALLGADSITLPAGVFVITLAGPGEDLAATGDLDVGSRVRVCGAGSESTIIDGNHLDRVVDVLPGSDVVICDVTIQNGEAAGEAGGGVRVLHRLRDACPS